MLDAVSGFADSALEGRREYGYGRSWPPIVRTSEIMLIPYAERVEANIRKLRDYCLDPRHPEGKHKARLFAAALGMTATDAEALRGILLQAVKTHDAQLAGRDQYGQRYTVDFTLEWHGKRAIIRSGWVIEHGSDTPRLTSCYPL
ncbi:MAG: DUF6883 domain-containing protein [Planctomycetota bacterium]